MNRHNGTDPCTACGGERRPGTGGRGWCHACYCRWDRAGRPEEGPPPFRGRGDQAGAAAHREDYFELTRDFGVHREEAARRAGVSLGTAERYERELRKATR